LDGILGGYGRVHPCDIDTSRNMIERFADVISGFNTAIDCGAGWGRITKELLIPKFKHVDLLEPAPVQIEKARAYVPEVRNFFLQGLQQFEPKDRYDCIWVQWCLCYLTDEDCLNFLERARESLTECPDEPTKSGLLFVKENIETG
jgi:protein N-terminal methyltransferase